jgi:hypothetical protein
MSCLRFFKCIKFISVADSGCLSRIPDPKQQQKRGVKKNCCHVIFCSHKFHKIENYFIFEMLRKILWANFQRIIELFTQKIVNKLSKIWVWVKKASDPGSGSSTMNFTKKIFFFFNILGIRQSVHEGMCACLCKLTLLGRTPGGRGRGTAASKYPLNTSYTQAESKEKHGVCDPLL